MLQQQRRNAIRWILGFVCTLIWADTSAALSDDLDLSRRRGRIHGPQQQAPAARALLGDVIVLPPVVDQGRGDRTRDDLSGAKAVGPRVAPSPHDKTWFMRRFWLANR
jgi:hypothetical protein